MCRVVSRGVSRVVSRGVSCGVTRGVSCRASSGFCCGLLFDVSRGVRRPAERIAQKPPPNLSAWLGHGCIGSRGFIIRRHAKTSPNLLAGPLEHACHAKHVMRNACDELEPLIGTAG